MTWTPLTGGAGRCLVLATTGAGCGGGGVGAVAWLDKARDALDAVDRNADGAHPEREPRGQRAGAVADLGARHHAPRRDRDQRVLPDDELAVADRVLIDLGRGPVRFGNVRA